MIGLLGRKKGMSAVWDASGRYVPVTVLEIGPCPVVQVKSEDGDGYNALQIAFDYRGEKNVSLPAKGHFRRAGVKPHRVLKEFRSFDGEHQAGEVLKVGLFREGDVVDVTGISKGRGFAGVIKRYHFNRPNQSHGTHESFRGPGSIGQHSFPARVWPGQHMAGRMGGKRVTVKNLKVIKVDSEGGVLLLKGAVPGAPGHLVSVCRRK